MTAEMIAGKERAALVRQRIERLAARSAQRRAELLGRYPTMVEDFGQWVVTADGIEVVDGDYQLMPEDLWRLNWSTHMLKKPWVNMESFLHAFFFARRHFASRRPATLIGDFERGF